MSVRVPKEPVYSLKDLVPETIPGPDPNTRPGLDFGIRPGLDFGTRPGPDFGSRGLDFEVGVRRRERIEPFGTVRLSQTQRSLAT